jgi:oxygen-independent coproporphyrinogen-3 oxidase
MNRLEIEKLLEKNLKRHLSNKVLHAHPSPALWRPQFDEITTNAKLTMNEGARTKVNMYAGITVCQPIHRIVAFVCSQLRTTREKMKCKCI